MSDQGGISYSPARVNPFANVQVASYPEHVQVANYSQITYLNTQESEEEQEEEPVDQESEPEYDVNEEQFEPPAPHRSPPAISSPTISSPPIALHKTKKEKVKPPTPKEPTSEKQPSKSLTPKQKKQAKKREKEKAKKEANNATKMTPSTESSEPSPPPASEAVPAKPPTDETNKSKDMAPSLQSTEPNLSKPPEPSEPPEPPEQPNENESAEVTDKQTGNVEAISLAESESLPSGGQSNEKDTREPASETVVGAESPQLEEPDVAISTQPISTTESDTPADIQEPNASALSIEESKLDTSNHDANVASETNREFPGEGNDQETRVTTDAGAISKPQTGEAADEPAVDSENTEPQNSKDVPGDNSKEETNNPEDTARESISSGKSDSAVAVEINEPFDEIGADTKTVQGSDETEQPGDTQKTEKLEGINEGLPDVNPTSSTRESLEESEDPQDPKTESNDESTTTEGKESPPNNKDELGSEAIKQEAIKQEAASDLGLSDVAPEGSSPSQIDQMTPTITKPVTEPQGQINNSEVTELPEVKHDESQAVIGLEDAESLKETANTDSGDVPTILPSESGSAAQADSLTEEHPGDPAAVESQEQAELSDQVANIPDLVAVNAPEVLAVQSYDNAEKLPETSLEHTEGSGNLEIPDEAVPEPAEEASDAGNAESATEGSINPQEPEISLDSEAKGQPIIPEQMAAELLPAPDDIPTQDKYTSQEPILEKSVPRAPTPTEPVSGEPTSQDPISQETATKGPISEEPSPQQPTPQEAVSKEVVPKDTVPQEPTIPILEDPVPREAAPEEGISQDTPQENISQETVSKEPSPQEPNSQEPIYQGAVSEVTTSEDLVSEEVVAKEPVQDSDSRELGSERTAPPEPVSEESASQEPISQEPISQEPISQEPISQEPISQEIIPEELAENLVPQDPDNQKPVVKEPASQEHDPQDSQNSDPQKSASQEPAPQEPASNDHSPPQKPDAQDEIPVVSRDDTKSLQETSTEEVGQSTAPDTDPPINDSDKQLPDQPNAQPNANRDSEEQEVPGLAPPVQQPAREITPSKPPITTENNSLGLLVADPDSNNTADVIGSLSGDEFVIVDKIDGEMNETMDSSEQLERQGDAKPNDFSQLDPEGEHQTITPDENSSQVHRGEGGDASPSDQSQELLGDGNDDTSNGAQPHDSNTSRAKVDIVEPAKPSLPESTTPSHESKEHEQEVEKQEFNQPASIPAEQHIESHDGADAPKDEDKIPQEPAPAVINNQTTGPNTESSEPQVNSDPQRADIEENENPVDPSGSSLEASAGPEDPAPGDGLPEPPPDVGEESIEQEASIERDPDDGVTQSTPIDEVIINDQVALNPEAPALKDVSLSQSESDLNETTPLVEAESSPIAPTESELSQTVEDKEESGSQLGLKTESPPKVLPGDLVEVPASSQETEKQPDQTPLLGNESIGEQIPQEAINLNEANGEEEEISKEMHSPDQSAELLSLDSETDNHGDLQSKSPSNPEQEEQLGSKSSGTLEEPEQPDENETFEGTEEEDSHKIPREALESVEIPSVTSQDQTSLDQTGQYAPVLAEQNELMSQPLTVNSQQSETDGKGEEAIEKAQEQEPAPSPSPPLTESLTGPFQSSIHKNSESQDITLSEPALAQETESQQDPDPHEDASSRPSQIPPDHEPAAIKEPEPEPTPSEIIQGEPSVPEKLNTEAQTVSYEQIVVEQTSATPVDDQVSVETQNSEDHVSIDSIRTKEQATTEDHPKEEFPTELPVLSQPQGNEAEETADDNSQVDPEEPAIEVADKADKEPEASGPIQEQAPADSQAPVNKMSTEDQPMEDKSTVDTPVEGQVPAGSQPSIGGWASIEDKEVAENGTPVSPSTSEEHSGNIIPAAVDLPTEQLPDQPPESDLQEPQDHNIETAERSDQAIVTEDPSNASNEFDGEVVVPEFTEGQTLDKPASGPIAEANTEQLAGEETKGELLSTATVLDEAQGNELVEDTDPKDKPIPEEPEVIHIQDNQNEVPDTRLLDSATNEQVPPQEPELSSESIVLSRPQENKDAEATIPSDKAVSGGPEAVHIQDNQSGEPNSISSDPSTQDPNPSQEHNPADQIFIESDNEAEILPNTSLGDTTQPITTDPKAPIDDSSKQLITQDFEGYAPDKDVDGLEQPEITHEELSALVTSPQFPENNDDKAAHRAQAEPKQVQPTEISEPARADVIVDIKEAVIDEDPAHDTSETLNLGDVPSLEAAGNDSPAVAGDLAPPPDKTDQSIEVIQQEAENSSKQPHSEITTPDQSQRIQEDTTGLGDNPVPEESLSDIIAPDQTQEHEETTRGLGDKAVLVEPVNNNKPRPIRAPKENTRVIEEVKAEKIRSYDESKDTVGPIPTDGGPIRMASKGEDQLFSSLVGDTPGVGANDFDDTPESVPEHLFSVEKVEVSGEDSQDIADASNPLHLGASLYIGKLSLESREDIESFNRSLAQNHPGTLSEQSNDGEPSFISPLEVQDATEARNRSLALQHNPDEEMEAFPGARLAEDARILSSADNTATPQVQEHEGGSSEIPEALELNIRSGSKDLPDITTDTSDEDEFLPGSNQEQTSEESLLAIPETSIHDEPIEGYQDSSFVNISSADLENSPGLTPQEPNKDGDHDILAFSKELQPEISGVVASKPLETGRDSGSKELSLQQKSEFVPSDTPEVLDITKVSDDPLASTKVKRLAYNLEAAKGHLNMVKLGIFRPTAFTVAGGALTRRHPVESDDEQAASGLPLNSAEVPVKKPAEPEPVAVSRDLSPLEKSISSLPSEGDEECNPPQRLSKPADPVDTPILTRGKPDRETKSVWNDPSHQTTESQQELAHFITPESPEIVASVIPLSESFTVIERGPIPQNSSRRTLRPPLVHSSTQTEDDRDFGSQPSWSFINLTDLEPRSKTPGIILPDLTDSKARALGRVKSVRKQRRQTLKKAEEAVAAAVILYAAAQELSPSSSSLLGSPQVENSTGETREPTRKGTQEAGVFFPADVVTGNQSVGQNDYSLPVADLSTDDEEKKSADERHHRHRRHHHHHHHSSRSKDVKGSGEHLHPRNTRIESNHSIKSSSDRSIPQTPKRDSGFSVESSHNTDTSHPRHRTPEEQAAHERRKEERRIAREAYDMAREDKGKDSEAPPSDRHSSHRSSRRYSLPHSEKSHTERRSERFQPERYSERSQPEKYPERSFSERHSERPSERPQPERYSERSHSERHPAKDSASSSNKRFFDMRHGESSLASTYVPRTRSNSTNVPPPVFKEPSKSSGLLKRTNTGKSSKSHRESGEIPRPRSHRSHDHDHDQDASSKRRRSEAKISGSLESTSSKTTPPSPTKDEHRQLRQKERQKAREATEAAEAKKKSGGIRAAFKKLFS